MVSIGMRLAVAVAAAGFVTLAACKKREPELTWREVALPGFSLELPDTRSMGPKDAGERYAAGTIRRGRSTRPVHVVGVNWQPGVLSTDEELTDMMEMMAKAMSDTPVKPRVTGTPVRETIAGEPAVRLDFAVGPMALRLVEVTCGGRAIQLFAGAPESPDEIMDRMVATFRCTPIAEREAEIAPDRSPVGFEGLPDGWKRTEIDGSGFAITDGVTLAFFAPLSDAGAIERIGFDKIIGAMLEIALGGWDPSDTFHSTRHGASRDIAFGTAPNEDSTIDVGATTWNCPGGAPIFAFAMNLAAETPAESRANAIDILSRARCLGPGEQPPAFELTELLADEEEDVIE